MGERQKRKLNRCHVPRTFTQKIPVFFLTQLSFSVDQNLRSWGELRPDFNEGRDGTSLREVVCKQEDAAVVTGTGKRHLWGLPRKLTEARCVTIKSCHAMHSLKCHHCIQILENISLSIPGDILDPTYLPFKEIF